MNTDNKQEENKQCTIPSVSSSLTCPYCQGDGFTSEHDRHPHLDGDCSGMCPIQVQCHYCQATGKVNQSVIDEFNKNKIVSDEIESDLPF
jgi:RecJ-like exonuclease